MDRVYCVSAVDSAVNPLGVAQGLAIAEPGYFRRRASHVAGRTAGVEAVRYDRDAAEVPAEENGQSGRPTQEPAWAA